MYSTEKHSLLSKRESNHSITNYTLSKRLNLLLLHSTISVSFLKMELTAFHTATILSQKKKKKKKKELKKNKSMKIISMMNMNLTVVTIIIPMTIMTYTFE